MGIFNNGARRCMETLVHLGLVRYLGDNRFEVFDLNIAKRLESLEKRLATVEQLLVLRGDATFLGEGSEPGESSDQP